MAAPTIQYGARRAGFTLVEVVVALFLLAACLIPVANAVRSGVKAPADGELAARNLECVKTLMETVMGTPYDVLYGQLNNFGPAYQIPGDANCPARQVTIMQYGNESTKTIGQPGTSPYLLYVSVGLVSPPEGSPYTLTSLVAR